MIRWMAAVAAACAVSACSAGRDAPEQESRAREEVRQVAALPAAEQAQALEFQLHQGEPGVVDSIAVLRGGRELQTLRPGENLLPTGVEVERLSRIDLDFDGHADLAFLSTLAMANSRSRYWRFDPRTGRFHDAGEFDTLAPDSAAGELTTFNRGGHAGRLWTAARWRWLDGRLLTVAEEEQAWLEDAERYVHVVRRRQDGRMMEVRRDTLDEAQLRAGPSWME